MLALTVALVALVLGPAAAALGQAPQLTIEAPEGSPTNNPHPQLRGGTDDSLDDVTVVIEAVGGGGSVVLNAAPVGEEWSVSPAQTLSDGEYTARATQTNGLGEEGQSGSVSFTIDTTSPTVTLDQPSSPSNDTKPTFGGFSSDSTNVVVRIYNSSHTEVTSANGGGGDSWTAGNENSLSSGTYTAHAEQSDQAGNTGTSNTVTFTIDTSSPTVTLDQPSSPSNNTEPTFSGTASDTKPVVVHIFNTGHSEVASATTAGTGGSWSASNEGSLPSGSYTAVATQESSLGNPAGQSAEVAFTIETNSPTVALNQPTSPSNNTKPTFSGTASDTKPVVVEIFNAAHSKVTSATTAGTGGSWSAGNEASLPSGTYKAVATQESSVGNPAGKSNEVAFTIQTASPTVVLSQPTALSNNTKPTFSGTATDITPVVVHIFNAVHSEVTSATTAGTGGSWSAGNEASLSNGSYTALATQESSLGNPAGTSKEVAFTVETNPPTVVLNQPTPVSNNTKPVFSGTASDSTEVVVHVYNAARVEVAHAGTKPIAGSWKTGALSPALATGKNTYTVVATQVSSLGNPSGESSTFAFEVDTQPPAVTLDPLVAHTNNATPSFSGTTSDTTRVTVQVYIIEKGAESLIATVSGAPTIGPPPRTWAAGPATLRTGKHTYTAIATQESSLGNPAGKSEKITFAVDTEAPSVTLNALASPTSNRSPSFTGTASEREPVSIRIHKGSTIDGQLVAETSATGTGAGWTSGPASPALEDGEYVAEATQASAFGHDPGGASSSPFVVDTTAPQVSIATPTPGSSTSSSSQLVEGAAGTGVGDLPGVTVQLFTGSQIAAGQSPAQTVQVPVNAGHWSVTLAGLGPGSYVVRAQQADAAGNLGVSAPTSFSVLAPPAAATPAGPSATFSWSPSMPHVGETISLLSNSTDASNPITAFAWDLSGTGVFAGGGPVNGTSFSTPGKHLVRLRVTDAAGLSAVAAQTIDVAASSVRLMHPFPTVRIAARGAGAGIRLKLLSVRAPAGARIAVGCSGRGCPVKSQSRIAAVGKPGAPPLEFRRFERFLRPGIVLQIRISKPGEIGKYTRFVVRRGRLPSRSDACIASATAKPIACPAP
jgi:large repetitive protein